MDTISTVEDVEYCRWTPSVLLRMFSIVEGNYQYCGRIPKVLMVPLQGQSAEHPIVLSTLQCADGIPHSNVDIPQQH